MILRAEMCNAVPIRDLGETVQSRCTYCCTRVELGPQLAELIAAWPTLTDRQRRGLILMADVTSTQV